MEKEKLIFKSRRKAHQLMKQLYPEINWNSHCVHHRDLNPLNNKILNLAIIDIGDHVRLHAALLQPYQNSPVKEKRSKPKVIKQMQQIDKLLPIRLDNYRLRCGHYEVENCKCWD